MSRRFVLLGVILFFFAGCFKEKISAREGPASFTVEILSSDDGGFSGDCASAAPYGTTACRMTFPEEDIPFALSIRATAIDQNGEFMSTFAGSAQVDIRPGRFNGVGPAGILLNFNAGIAETDLTLIHAYGETRVWVEDCGSDNSYATGVSPALWFEAPRIDQINRTIDNTTSPLVPRSTNVCAITSDPRFGIGTDEEGETAFVGYSHGKTVNAPPPAMGTYLEITGCTKEEYNIGQCAKGPLIVTGITNEGFYVTDLHPDVAAGGFNHLYSFNFNYPADTVVGDLVTSLRGSPVEFTGSTQLSSPTWTVDRKGYSPELLPTPVTLSADTYRAAVKTYGRNRSEILDLEALEGAVVCMDNLAPSANIVNCDVNESGRIERQGNLFDNEVDFSESPLTSEQVEACGLTNYVPNNPAEYCCERLCYNDQSFSTPGTSLGCSEESAYILYGQWVADAYGRYEMTDGEPVKMAIVTRNAQPDFDPFTFAQEQLAKSAASRDTVKVVGNLRQVLAARPVWVIIASSPDDIEINGTCP